MVSIFSSNSLNCWLQSGNGFSGTKVLNIAVNVEMELKVSESEWTLGEFLKWYFEQISKYLWITLRNYSYHESVLELFLLTNSCTSVVELY